MGTSIDVLGNSNPPLGISTPVRLGAKVKRKKRTAFGSN
jgi:hypothetical protein